MLKKVNFISYSLLISFLGISKRKRNGVIFGFMGFKMSKRSN